MSAAPERQAGDELLAKLDAHTLTLLRRRYVAGQTSDLRAVIGRLLQHGLSLEECYSVVVNPRWPVSQIARDIGEAETRRKIERERNALDYNEAEEPEPPSDEGELASDDKGLPIRSAANVRVAIRRLGAEVDYDKFANRVHLHVVGDRERGWRGHNLDLDDNGLVALRIACDEIGLRISKDQFRDWVKNYAYRRRYHPVLEYLVSLKWDGEPRVGRWLHTYLSVSDNDYSRAVGQLLLVAAVRRVRKPGEKFDEMLLLEGPQGGLKSAALKVLAVRDEWFTDDLPLGADSKLVLERT